MSDQNLAEVNFQLVAGHVTYGDDASEQPGSVKSSAFPPPTHRTLLNTAFGNKNRILSFPPKAFTNNIFKKTYIN